MKNITMALAIVAVSLLLIAASYQTAVYMEQGGAKQVVATGGEVEVQSGGTLDVQSGATLNMLGRTVVMGQYDDDPDAADDSVYVSTIDADDILFVTVNDPTNGAYLLSAEPFAGGFLYTLSADPADSVRISYIALTD